MLSKFNLRRAFDVEVIQHNNSQLQLRGDSRRSAADGQPDDPALAKKRRKQEKESFKSLFRNIPGHNLPPASSPAPRSHSLCRQNRHKKGPLLHGTHHAPTREGNRGQTPRRRTCCCLRLHRNDPGKPPPAPRWVAEISSPLELSLELILSPRILSYRRNQSQMKTGRRKRQRPPLFSQLPCQSLTPRLVLFTYRKSEKENTTAHITWQLQETHHHPHTHTHTSNRSIATRPHRRPPRTSRRQAEHLQLPTLPNVGLCEKSATSLRARLAESRPVRNADRCVLSLSLLRSACRSPINSSPFPIQMNPGSWRAWLTLFCFLQRVSRRPIRYSSSPRRRDRDGRSFPRSFRLLIPNLLSFGWTRVSLIHAYPQSHNTVLSCITW